MPKAITLQEFIMDSQAEFPFVSGQLTRLLTDIGVAAKIVNHQVNRAGLAGILGQSGSQNTHNEDQQKLDVFADKTFMRILTAGKSVAGIGSEEQDDYILCHDQGKEGKYVVMIDPLDGSSNIDVNVSIGTIFSIYRRVTPLGEPLSSQDFLQKGTEQVVAGYILYGSSTMLVYTTGTGVNGFTMDPAIGEFFLSHPNMEFPESAIIYSINDALLHKAPQAVQKFIGGCRETLGVGLKARYIGSLVTDFHRNLIKGGIYLYPSTENNPEGKLRLMYECNPLAFIAQQAGGTAENNTSDILEIQPRALHERSPFYVGSRNMVQGLRSCWMATSDPE
jgi:fructose-1,6-bisphosphatase I